MCERGCGGGGYREAAGQAGRSVQGFPLDKAFVRTSDGSVRRVDRGSVESYDAMLCSAVEYSCCDVVLQESGAGRKM